MRIAELARRAGVKVSTIRFYERSGVLAVPPRSPAGYRDYDDTAVQHVRFLRRGQHLGFRLVELGAVASRPSAEPLTGDQIADAAQQKLREIDAQIEELARMRGDVEGLLAEQCADRRAACPIVAALAGSSGA